MCKHPVALVEWDPIFEYADCHVPLNPNKYNKEDEYCGWNMLNKKITSASCVKYRQQKQR